MDTNNLGEWTTPPAPDYSRCYTTERLTASALFWLLTDGKCKLVTVERGLAWGNPDALGVTEDRTLSEIEVKVSMSDFRANNDKSYIRDLTHRISDPSISTLPSRYYFLVPPCLAEKVQAELPAFAGLLTVDVTKQGAPFTFTNGALCLRSVVKAPRMPRKKLNLRQCVSLAKHQSMAFAVEMLRRVTR